MHSLIIDTTQGTNIALVAQESTRIVSCKILGRAEKNSQLENIAVLTSALVGSSQIDQVLVSTGPASYTGLRIGISFARGLSSALEIPLRAYSTHDLVAAYYGLEVVETNAKRAQKFISKYTCAGMKRISMAVDNAGDFEEITIVRDFEGMAKFLALNIGTLELPVTPIYLRAPDAKANIKPPIVFLETGLEKIPELSSIQEASSDDLDELVVVEKQIFALDAWSSKTIENALNNPEVKVLKVVHNSKIVGMSITTFPKFNDLPADLDSVGVLPEYRNQKLGKKLLEKTLEVLKKSGLQRIQLEVRSSNFIAQELYKEFGFKQIRTRAKYYKMAESGDEDAIVMEYVFNSGQKTAPDLSSPIIMGIESSCDETGVAFIQNGHILGSALSSSMSEHAKFGGVIPEIASRAHESMLVQVTQQAIERVRILQPNFHLRNIQAVAHASAPGLVGSLAAGAAFAKGIALALSCPIYAVNHVDAHIFASGIRIHHDQNQLPKRFLGVIISGGHTALVLVDDMNFKLIGSTLDDAAGEAFDKIGRVLGLEYPAGPQIDLLAQSGRKDAICFPRPLTDAKFNKEHRYDFSFSGMKTAAIYELERQRELPKDQQISLNDFCASFAESVADVILIKIKRAIDDFALTSIVLGGGFSANSQLREKLHIFARNEQLDLHIPSTNLCTDNGEMVAYLTEQLFLRGAASSDLNYSVQSVLSPNIVQI
ncbi:MAG: tRNA (adenosine(37)-N6)-threonylcarbamoyltransferase complex transferase subunit TsaD [Candidatus Ancillula sp.]|jgi:N6-L-threonylcarbamoyladenine synthase|nr:tRNA (adenosine(37)-N6)-threonylcarbamoyltransferase complex transferase subunit TsaD [Candidatus Ancillula sp.]